MRSLKSSQPQEPSHYLVSRARWDRCREMQKRISITFSKFAPFLNCEKKLVTLCSWLELLVACVWLNKHRRKVWRPWLQNFNKFFSWLYFIYSLILQTNTDLLKVHILVTMWQKSKSISSVSRNKVRRKPLTWKQQLEEHISSLHHRHTCGPSYILWQSGWILSEEPHLDWKREITIESWFRF